MAKLRILTAVALLTGVFATAGAQNLDMEGTQPVADGSKPMRGLRPFLDRVRDSGIGLIGMKAGRYLAGRRILGWSDPKAFDSHYSKDFLASGLSPFQRSYAFVLAHGLDAVNADMQSLAHLEENVAAVAASPKYFA